MNYMQINTATLWFTISVIRVTIKVRAIREERDPTADRRPSLRNKVN